MSTVMQVTKYLFVNFVPMVRGFNETTSFWLFRSVSEGAGWDYEKKIRLCIISDQIC